MSFAAPVDYQNSRSEYVKLADVDLDGLSVSSAGTFTSARGASVTLNADGSYSFDPSASAYQSLGVGQSTILTVPYTVTDDQGVTSTANLVITVTGTNDAPLASVASATVAVEPDDFAMAPVPAIRRATERAGVALGHAQLLDHVLGEDGAHPVVRAPLRELPPEEELERGRVVGRHVGSRWWCGRGHAKALVTSEDFRKAPEV